MNDKNGHDTGKASKGSLAEMVAETPALTFSQSFPPETCARIVLLAGLLVWLNFWQLRIMARTWMDNPNWSHGFLIPLFSIYFLYSRRDELFMAKRRTCFWGLPMMLVGILWVVVGFYPIRNNWFSHLGIIPMVVGLVLYLAGPRVLRVVWLPILFLAFAMPLSGALYEQIALPLQNLAAAASGAILKLCGVKITVKQSALQLMSVSGVIRDLTVAEACSGVRMLVAFMALGVAMAYLDDKPIWQRVTLVLMGVPIAVASNVLRVVITSTAYVQDRPEFGQDFMHSFTGMLMLIPALLMLWGLNWLLQSLFVADEEDDRDGHERGLPRGAREGSALTGGGEK
ncbi:MAG: exosortase/archaeosortase family protein [Phycisphaerae bacterium]|nr:exosortase/archaeosortase family protein [Phycisphaerae bacterium]